MKIDDGIPLPGKRYGPRSVSGHRAHMMKIKGSVFCKTEVEAQRLRDALRHLGAKTMRRKRVEDGIQGVRVWRTA